MGRRSVMLLLIVVSGSCATYYQAHRDFYSAFETGSIDEALRILKRDNDQSDRRNRFLYFVNRGLLLSMSGQYEESNREFERAFLFGEDYRINYIAEGASYLTNPMITVYRGEDHEHLLVLYYKAINYLKMGMPDQALVECRRMEIRLNQLSDRYDNPDKYRQDAFIHLLMGIIYQAEKDYNNAFIAYRNSLNIYESDYARLYGLATPAQLKSDLLFSAWQTGFNEEFEFYKDKFGMHDYHPVVPEAELVFFWHNGLAPVKDEWSLNFVISYPRADEVVFTNAATGMQFSFPLEDDDDRKSLKGMGFFRVAFPKYVERQTYYRDATLSVNNKDYPLELAEDVNAIAFHSLQERMMLEFSKGLLRAALKKATARKIKKEDKGLGTVIDLVNALTEKADTRNWQTLMHEIRYTRVSLPVDSVEAVFTLRGPESEALRFTYHANEGQTLFHTFSSLESGGRRYLPD